MIWDIEKKDVFLDNLVRPECKEELNSLLNFYPAALKGSGVLSYPERAAGGRQGRQAPLTLSRL